MEDKDNKEHKENNDNRENDDNNWPVTISFNIVSGVCPFNGSRITDTSVFGNDPIKNNCFHPMSQLPPPKGGGLYLRMQRGQ